MKRTLLAAGASLLLAAACAAPAAAQGVVLGKGSAPIPVARTRALLVFQDLGTLSNPQALARHNRENLLVEIELSGPAPEGTVWVLAAPGGAAARPGPAPVLDEMSAYWRATRAPDGTTASLAPAWPPSGPGPVPEEIIGPVDLDALGGILKARGIELPADIRAVATRQASAGWRFFLAKVPAGTTRLAAQLSFNSEVAQYPGALGGTAAAEAVKAGAWGLPPLELMVLHSHFLNVDDNVVGLKPRLGLERAYQDAGTLQDGGQLWANPAESRPGPVREAAGQLKATAAFMTVAAPQGLLFLSVVSGSPRAAERARLDFAIFSHYPSGIDPLPAGGSFLWLAAISVALVFLAVWLLKRKGFAE